MAEGRTLLILEILALWTSLAALAFVTFAAFIASSTRSDCDSFVANITLASNPCTFRENLSAAVYHHTSYFQSAHIIIIHTIATFSLIVFKPSLSAMAWSVLQSSSLSNNGVKGLTMSAFQNGVDLANSPALVPSLLYTKASHSLKPHAAFVVVVSVLSLFSAIAVSPIYRSHTGPFNIAASIVNGGGVGPSIASTFDGADIIPGGVVAGRSLISAGTILNSTIYPEIFDIGVAPFIPLHAIRSTWHAQVETVVARNSLDCGSTAPMRISNGSQDLVNLGDSYFAAEQKSYTGIKPSFAGQKLGNIINDPVLIAVYLNSTTTASPGVVEAQTSVILLAANGTLEGAQQMITSPELTSRIGFVDVLVCTSTTRLEISVCTIDQGTVTSCVFQQPTDPSSSGSATGGVEAYVNNPKSVAITLAASPVTAYYILGHRLPMLGINQQYIESQTLPLSYLTSVTVNSMYAIPLTYVANVLFAQTAQGLVQGMITTWQTFADQQIAVIAVFGASQPILLLGIMAVCFALALVATVASTVPRSARRAPKLDVLRLLAISRNPQLDAVLQPYSDRDVGMDGKMESARVGYGWVEGLNRRALVMDPPPHSPEVIPLLPQSRYSSISKGY